MFEFLFKRQGGNKSDAMAPGAGASEQRASSPAESGAADVPVGAGPEAGARGPSPGKAGKQGGAPASRERQADQLKQLNGDENAAVEFILSSEYSELRLAAAELIHSQAQLERVHTAMRNLDRRVAKLMQSRLDAIRHHDAELRRGQEALAQAKSLLGDALLTPNHVAELDRKWSIIQAPELTAEFDAVRAELAHRLEAQVQLQRAMIDRLAALRQLNAAALDAAELAGRLAALQAEQEAALAAPEHASLGHPAVA